MALEILIDDALVSVSSDTILPDDVIRFNLVYNRSFFKACFDLEDELEFRLFE